MIFQPYFPYSIHEWTFVLKHLYDVHRPSRDDEYQSVFEQPFSLSVRLKVEQGDNLVERSSGESLGEGLTKTVAGNEVFHQRTGPKEPLSVLY